MTNLKLSGQGADSRAEGISDQGWIVGWRGPFNAPTNAFVWTPTVPRGTVGTATNLLTLGNEASAHAINATGHIVGMSRATAGGVSKAVLWSPASSGGYGPPLDLGTAPGLSGGFAWGVNDFQSGAPQIVGSTDFTQTEQALVWPVTFANGVVTASPAQLLGGLVIGQGSSARATNATGQVVGYASVLASSGVHNHAVLWTRSSGAWAILDLLPNSVESVASGINAEGYIVGQEGNHAFLRAPDGQITTLPTLGGTTAGAFAINDAGEIAGYALPRGGGGRAVLWLPTAGGYRTKDLGRPSGGLGFAVNEPSGGVTEVVGSASSHGTEHGVLWTAQ